MLYVFGLVSAFASAWFVLAALQTFTDAAPERLTNIIVAVAFAALSAATFWLARRARTESTTSTDAGAINMSKPR
jgi:hypothetical protein